jgi:hypothetical protein
MPGWRLAYGAEQIDVDCGDERRPALIGKQGFKNYSRIGFRQVQGA